MKYAGFIVWKEKLHAELCAMLRRGDKTVVHGVEGEANDALAGSPSCRPLSNAK